MHICQCNLHVLCHTGLYYYVCFFARENEQCLSERLREVEREKEEEAKRLQELIDMQNERHFKELEDLRNSEDRLKRELRFAIDEAKQKNIQKQL